MNRLMLAVTSTVSLLALSASAAPGRYWAQFDGTYDGDWTDLNHWDGGLWPGAGDCAYFRAAVEGTVNVNTNAVTGYWVISPKDELPRTSVTWTGTGSLTNTATAVTWISRNRKLTIDGPDIYVHRELYLDTNAVLDVRSGHLRARSLSLMEASLVSLSGGLLQSGSFAFEGNSLLRLAGGVLQMENGTTLTDVAHFSHEGGTLRLTNERIDSDCWSLLPKAGTTVDVCSGRDANAVYVSTSFSTNVIDGTLYVTNRTVAAYPHQRYHSQKAHHTVLGTGSLYLDAFGVRGGYAITIAGPRLFLGVGLDGENSDNGIYYKFPQGISFGSWGDWSNDVGAGTVSGDGGSVANIQFAGDVSFDTRDCFDGTTKHHIRLLKCSDQGMTSLRVTGGGTVDLAFKSAITGLKELVVEAGTVLYLTNTTGNVTVEKVVLGADAALHLATSLVGCKSIETGADAVLDVPNQVIALTGLTELDVGDGGTLDLTAIVKSPLHLYRLTLGAGAILKLPLASGGIEVYRLNCAAGSKVAFSGEPTGSWLVPVWSAWDAQGTQPTVVVGGYDTSKWELRDVEGVLYLANEADNPGAADGGNYNSWLGTVSSLWSDGENWKLGTSPSGGTYCYFSIDTTPYVTNDYAKTLRYPCIHDTAGPYFFRGNALTLSYGAVKATSNTINHRSPFPAVFEMPLTFSGAIPYLRVTGDSYLAVTNGCAMDGKALYVTGDVRLGGDWSCTNLLTTATGKHGHLVTVYPNSTLTMTASGEAFPAFPKMVVDGTFDVSNTLTSVAAADWLGEGAVKLHTVATDETAAFALREKLTLYPEEGWTTVAAAMPDAAVTIAASDTPTLGATRDWTYGPAADAEPTTSAADRALTVGEEAVLTIDTEDPVTGEGHVVTFADPIVAAGKVVKTGAGTLVLASDANAIGDLVVEGGAIAIPVAQTLDKVTFAAGATLALGDEQKAAAESGWTTVLTAKSVTGLGDKLEGGRYKLRTLTADGLTVVQAKAKQGLSIILK